MGAMRVPWLLLLLAFWWQVLLWPLGPALAVPPEQPLRVTTDGVAYCRHLASRLATPPGAMDRPPQARDLPAHAIDLQSRVQAALRLCETGHARSGIARLRRLLRDARPPDDAAPRTPSPR